MSTRVSRRAVLLVLAVSGLLGTPLASHGAEIDLAARFMGGPSSAQPGEAVQYWVAYGNLSDIVPVDSYLNVDLPVGAYMDDPDFNPAWGDSLGNVAVLFISNSCENLLIQLQGPGDPDDRPIPLDVPAQTTGLLTLALEMPMRSFKTRAVRVQYPDTESLDLPHSPGVCGDCSDPATCFGPRISSIVPPIETEYVLVDTDNGQPGYQTLGCVSIKNDVAGKIALVRRGECEFGLKAVNAQIADAIGIVIMNNDPDQDVTSFSMRGGQFGPLVTIPVALVNNAVGDPMETAYLSGDTLLGVMGGVESDSLVFKASIFHGENSVDEDPDLTNNVDNFVTSVPLPLFADGFESGDTTAWSNSVP